MLYDFIVIGAGASGLFFAATRQGDGPVLLLDRQDRAGRKLLLSGGGKCNVTNKSVSPENYLGENSLFSRQALEAFAPGQMLDFLRQRSIPIEEREYGQIFCRQGAETLRDALLRLAVGNRAEPLLGCEIRSVQALAQESPDKARFAVETASARHLSRNLLIACGGPAWPRSGATFFAKKLAAVFGHNYLAPRPALTPLKMPGDWPLHGLQGLSLDARVSAPSGPGFILPLLFTHNGLSGPACLQASSYLQTGEALKIDFLPGTSFSALLDAEGRQSPLAFLRRHLPARLAQALFSTPALLPLASRKSAELPRSARSALSDAVHAHEATPITPDFAQAESSSGGIDTRQVNPKTMESRLQPGLYFAGEALDICGQLGGYNLHWAWASAFAAGRR